MPRQQDLEPFLQEVPIFRRVTAAPVPVADRGAAWAREGLLARCRPIELPAV